MSTFQLALAQGMGASFIGTGNLANGSNADSRNKGLESTGLSDFAWDVIARLPTAIRELIQEPCTYAPYRDSLEHFLNLVECVGNGESEINEANYPKFLSAAEAAIELLLSRPRSLPLPEFDVRPNGKIEFEWYQGPRNLISFTIDHNRKLVYSALIGDEKIGASKTVGDQWPVEVLDLVKRVKA